MSAKISPHKSCQSATGGLCDGCSVEHFLTILHVKLTDAEEITDVLTSFITEKNVDYKKLVGHGFMMVQ